MSVYQDDVERNTIYKVSSEISRRQQMRASKLLFNLAIEISLLFVVILIIMFGYFLYTGMSLVDIWIAVLLLAFWPFAFLIIGCIYKIKGSK